MFNKEIKQCKILIGVCLFLAAYGGFNIACGLFQIYNLPWIRVLSIVGGLFCSVASSWSVMKNIKTISNYETMSCRMEAMSSEISNLSTVLSNIANTPAP